MLGRFSARRGPAPEAAATIAELPAACDDGSWIAFPESAPEPVVPAAANPLQSHKLLDAKVRLHRQLIEEVNLQALEKLPDDEMRAHIQQLVSEYVLLERLALNTQELKKLILPQATTKAASTHGIVGKFKLSFARSTTAA